MQKLDSELIAFLRTLVYAILFIGIFWLIKVYEVTSGFKLTRFGVYPREADGFLGIFTGPFIHGSWDHLISNSFPLLMMILLLLSFYKRVAVVVFVLSWFFTGFMVWFFARPSYHIGASGVVYALIGFVLGSGLFRRNSLSIMLSLLILAVYSSYFIGFKQEEGVSWESHILGAVVGFVQAFLFKGVRENSEDHDDQIVYRETKKEFFFQRDTFEKTIYQRWLDSLAPTEGDQSGE